MKKEVIEVDLDQIKPNPFQPRKYFNEDTIKELASSMQALQDTVQDITVRKVNSHYEIIAGERRYRAAKLLTWKKVWVVVRQGVGNKEMRKHAFTENMLHEPLTDMEKAEALKGIAEEEGLFHIEAAKHRPKSDIGEIDISALAKSVGLTQGHISTIFDSAEVKTVLIINTVKLGITEEQIAKLGQNTVNETKVLPKEDREKVLVKSIKADFGGRKMRKLVSVIKKTEKDAPIREALLVEPSIAAEEGELVVEAELSSNGQKRVIKDIVKEKPKHVETIKALIVEEQVQERLGPKKRPIKTKEELIIEGLASDLEVIFQHCSALRNKLIRFVSDLKKHDIKNLSGIATQLGQYDLAGLAKQMVLLATFFNEKKGEKKCQKLLKG